MRSKASNARNDGRAFEGQLETIATQYVSKRIMRIKKCEQPLRIMGKRPFIKVVFMENPFLDFTGSWMERGGRMICFEAKSTTKPVLPIGGDNGMKQSQIDAMGYWLAAGAVSFLLWECKGVVKFVTYAEIRHRLDRDKIKHLKFEQCMETVNQGMGFTFFDFAVNMRKHFV